MIEMDDAWAVKQALAGNQGGYQLLFERYHQKIFRYVASYTRLEREQVLDIVQESFIRSFKALVRLEDPNKFYSLLLVTARNRGITQLSKKKRQREILSHYHYHLQCHPSNTDETVQKKAALVNAIIDSLPQGDIKETVKRYYLGQEITTDELAKELGIPKGTVTARIKRFRDHIKQKLASGLLEFDDDE